MTRERLLSPMRALQGVMNAISHSQGTMVEKLKNIVDIANLIYVGDVKVIGARTNREFTVKSIVGAGLVCPEGKWRGKVNLKESVKHVSERNHSRTSGVAATGDDLGADAVFEDRRLTLLKMAEVVVPLRVFVGAGLSVRTVRSA